MSITPPCFSHEVGYIVGGPLELNNSEKKYTKVQGGEYMAKRASKGTGFQLTGQ